MWQARPGSLAEIIETGIRVSQFNIERILKAFLPEAVPETFAELRIPLQVTATDFFGHKLAVLETGDLYSALAASAAIPALFRPVTRDGVMLIDGGFYNPVPFDLVEGRADIVIAVDVVGAPSDAERKHPTSVDLMFGATQLMMQSIIANKLSQCQPDILIRPPVSRFRVLDFLKMDAVMAETVQVKDELKRAIDAAVAAKSRQAPPRPIATR
jgi:NTE family protein